jgi:hypothetical protein
MPAGVSLFGVFQDIIPALEEMANIFTVLPMREYIVIVPDFSCELAKTDHVKPAIPGLAEKKKQVDCGIFAIVAPPCIPTALGKVNILLLAVIISPAARESGSSVNTKTLRMFIFMQGLLNKLLHSVLLIF